jgi:mRNA interferase MazF
MQRGEIWWADLEEPLGAEPGYRRPFVIVQSDAFNRSRIQTAIAIVVTSNLRLLDAPGNVLLPARGSGLKQDSVANISQVVTLDRDAFIERVGRVPHEAMVAIERGLRLVLDL